MSASVRTIVFVHAFGSSRRAWAPQIAGLGERYRLVAPDLPGHGRAAGPFTLEGAEAAVSHAPRLLALQRATMTVLPWRVLKALSQGFASGERREYVQIAGEDLQRCGKQTLLAALREVAHLDVRDRLPEISVPALVVCGARDRPNIAASRELAAGIRGAELRIVPGASHFWNLQLPELFNETVSRFVEGTSPPQPRRP